MGQPIQVFCCYAREDQPFLLVLKRHLRPFELDGLITVRADIDISPGEDWEQKINHYLNTAQMILLLISPDFMASDYCYSKEMMRAMERHKSGEACVIPILLRPTYWYRAPFGKLRVLPTNNEVVTSINWHTLDDAFFDVTKGIEKAVEKWKEAVVERKRLRQEQARMIALFGYETDDGTNSALWTDPINPELDETKFQQWRDTKRAFTEEEIAGHTWIKIANSGNIFITRFSDGEEGKLEESPLADPCQHWNGSWKLIEGMLRLNIDEYELDIFANHGEESIGTGIEFTQNQTTPDAYFTLLPLQENIAKHWPLEDVPALVEHIFEQILERSANQQELIAYGSLLHRGEMSVRNIIKILGCSQEYRKRFIDPETVGGALELCYKHFLGRMSDSLGRAFYPKDVKIRGFNWLINRITDSDEYVNQKFGEDKIPPDAITCLTAVSMYPGHLECFYRGSNNSLCHRWWYGPEVGGTGEWSEEHDLGGFLASAPAAISTKPHHIDCFYQGQNNHLWHRHWDGEQKIWSDEIDLGGKLSSAPAVVSWEPDHIDCFYRGLNNGLWHRRWDSEKNHWSEEENLGGALTLASAPSAISWRSNRINCVYRGTDNHLWEIWWNGKRWKRENNIEMILTSTPAITSRKPDYLDYFYRGLNNGLWHRRWNIKNQVWSNEENLEGFLTSAPTAVSWGNNRIDCFYCGKSNHLWHHWWDGERWNQEDLGDIVS